MAIPVKLPVFEGPLDLLMHLIEKNKIDIYDIPIVTVTDQYLEYIQQMDREDMNVTSEFMVMAATLIDIKCRMLLPKEVNEDGEEQDPREELVKQLLEYKKYKYMSSELRTMMNNAGDMVVRKKMLPDEVKNYAPPVDLEELLGDLNIDKLHKIFQSVLKRQENKIDPIRSKFGRIEKEDVSLPERLTYVERFAIRERHFSFRKLLEEQGGKIQVVVTFLAVLQLIKSGKIQISQDELFGDIIIDSLEEEGTEIEEYSEDDESFN
ncbi:MAG: segregation/condensation protein A [Lachnospiraceae bacterium]|nr:segregation/condensation protein A [Lachnospiraceae bacterium]